MASPPRPLPTTARPDGTGVMPAGQVARTPGFDDGLAALVRLLARQAAREHCDGAASESS